MDPFNPEPLATDLSLNPDIPISEPSEYPTFAFRHKSIRRYQIGDTQKRTFTFRDFVLKIAGPDSVKDRELFIGYVRDLPPIERNQIVEVNEAARAAAERPIGDGLTQKERVIRGLAPASSILTANDIQALKARGVPVGGDVGDGTQPLMPQTAPKPAGFTGVDLKGADLSAFSNK